MTFAIDDGFVAALKAGRIRIVPRVDRLDGADVILADGSVSKPDVVIAATGYRTDLAPLLGHLGVLDDRGQPLKPMGEPDPANPGLWFTGFKPIFTGYFDAAGITADRIASAITADAAKTVAVKNFGAPGNPATTQTTILADANPH